MTPIAVRLNLKNFILISYAVLELLKKESTPLPRLDRIKELIFMLPKISKNFWIKEIPPLVGETLTRP